MYSRTETSQMRQAFWTAFGQYMTLQPSAEGLRINWMNYKTGVRGIHFKMHAGIQSASVGIELAHTDLDVQQLYFEQFFQYKPLLLQHTKEEWAWVLHATDESGRIYSTVNSVRAGINIMNQQDWPELIQFFKPRIVALDAFWNEVKYGFEALR